MKELKDHRQIAKDLELYILEEKSGQGLPLLLPNYVIIRNQIQTFLREKQIIFGFQEVITPVLGSEDLYQTSGHLAHYEEYMFPVLSRNNENLRLRPMTCPHHCLIYQQKSRSYRELPLRLCENSFLFRYEASGGLKGLERPRTFELPDHHIFVSFDKLKEELKNNYHYISQILSVFDLQVKRLSFSTHNDNWQKYHPNKQIWEEAENILEEVLQELSINYIRLPGEAAFYGPKLDIEVEVADGKIITLATMQVDFLTPQKFDLQYINNQQELKTPVLIHQSPIGSYQRFIALLCEQSQGKLPFWLAPVQLTILTINEEEEIMKYSEELQKKLIRLNLRVEVWNHKTIGHRISQVHQKKVPYHLIIGKEELKTKKIKLVNNRLTDKNQENLTISEEELCERLKKENNINKNFSL